MVQKKTGSIYSGSEQMTKTKKILYCEGNVDGTVGGSYYLLFDLVLSLDKTKYCPVVVFYTDNILVPKLRRAGIETHVFKRSEPVVFGRNDKGSSKILKLFYDFLKPLQKAINIFVRLVFPGIKYAVYLKKNRFDMVNLNNSVVHNHDWMLGAKIAGVKCLTHEMGINNYFPRLARYFGKRLDAVICLSYAISDNMKSLGLNYPNITTIHCGIDLDRYQVKKKPDQLRKIYQIEKIDPIIGVVGNVKKWKGQETVVRATALIKEKRSNVKCVLVGDNSVNDRYYYDSLIRLCEELDISENIIFTGFQKNVVDFMNLMDIVIHSSIEPEPFGIVNLEAMSVKKPVISTKIGAPAEIYQNGISGILVEAGNPKELADACLDLLENPEKARKMGLAAYERLRNEFMLEKNIKQTEKVYDSILAQPQ